LSEKKFVKSGTFLFLDIFILSAGNWIYWLFISKIVLTSEVGQATTIVSLVMLGTTIAQLGFEYPLLKFARSRSQIIGTTLVIELLLMVILILITFFVIIDWYEESSLEFAFIAVMMIFSAGFNFVIRFSMLGLNYVRKVLIITIIGVSIKFVTGYTLAIMGYGTHAILLSFLLFFLTISIGYLIGILKNSTLQLGDIKLTKEVLRIGLVNAPNKLSKTAILYLVIVLLPLFGIDDSSIGIFYITLMISILVAGSFASSIAYMVIPASSKLQADLSSESMRLGLSFTVPIIVTLLVVPKLILSLIGPEYTSASNIMMILSAGIIPFIIIMNSISRFNNLNKSKELVIIGIIQIITLLVTFWILVPQYQTLGAALSIVATFFACSTPLIIWSERRTKRHILVSSISVAIGWGTGYAILTIIQLNNILALIISLFVSSAIIILLKNTSITEVGQIIRMIIKTK